MLSKPNVIKGKCHQRQMLSKPNIIKVTSLHLQCLHCSPLSALLLSDFSPIHIIELSQIERQTDNFHLTKNDTKMAAASSKLVQ